MHGVTGFVESAALLVCAAFVLVTICSRIGVPSIVGYILAGIVIGPAGLGLIAESAALSSIGEIGVVLLLFALGLEFSFEKLVTLRKHVFGLGAVQVSVTTITVSLVASLVFDLASVSAILIGGAVAMSSTAMCLKGRCHVVRLRPDEALSVKLRQLRRSRPSSAPWRGSDECGWRGRSVFDATGQNDF